MKATIKRRHNEFNSKISMRILYVVKDQYIQCIIKDIIETLPRHQESIRNLQDNGHEIIGYIRKSTGEKDESTRIRLMNQMSTNLKERSLVTKVYASASCDANQPLLVRDVKKNTDMLSKITADGDMQDLLAYICTRDKICIVVINFAGLTTNTEDLEHFLRNNRNIVKLIVDQLPHTNSIHTYTTEELLKDQNKLQVFNCRNNTVFKRSLK